MATRETLAVTDTATGLTLATVRANGEDTALITVETAEIRFTVDGTTATSSIGHVVGSGGTIKLETSTELTQFSVIRTTGVSASLQVSTRIRSR